MKALPAMPHEKHYAYGAEHLWANDAVPILRAYLARAMEGKT